MKNIPVVLFTAWLILGGWTAPVAAEPGLSEKGQVELSGPINKAVSLDYAAAGGTASTISKGTGKDFELAPGTLPAAPGETSETIPLTVRDDTIRENTKTVEIALSDPRGATPGGKETHSPRKIDSDRQVLVNVKDAGARGDGVTDDTAAIQKAVDRVYAKGGGVVLFPPGRYVVTSVNIRENITYQGDQATITRPARQGKWTRTFTTQNNQYSGTEDSKPLIIKNLTFDGNSQNQGPYHKYELEQAHLIFLTANNTKPGRLRAIVEDCRFQNGVGDGISCSKNVDLKIYNCTAENVFRGGFVLTGGYSKLYVKNFTAGGAIDPTGFDIEIDGSGYGGSQSVSVVLEDITCLNGDADMAIGDNSTLVARRIKSLAPPAGKPSFYFNSRGNGVAEFYDCKFYANQGLHRIQYPGKVTFTRCTFVATDSEGGAKEVVAFPQITWRTARRYCANQTVKLNDCVFTAELGGNPPASRAAIKYTATDLKDNNVLIIRGGEFTDKLNEGITHISGGGKIVLTAVTINLDTSSKTYPIYLSGNDTTRNWDVTIDNCKFNTTTYIYIYGHSGENYPCTKNFLRQGNITIQKSQNVIGSHDGFLNNNFVGIGKNPIMRVIQGMGAPGNTPGFKSADGKYYDQYQDITDPKNPVYYKCTNMKPFTWTQYTP